MKWTQTAADQPALGRVVHDRMIKSGTVRPEPSRQVQQAFSAEAARQRGGQLAG